MHAFRLQRRVAALLGCHDRNGRCAGNDASSGGCSEKVEGLPAPVSKCFIVEKKDAEKWPPKQHTPMVANAKSMAIWRFSSFLESSGLGIENPAPRGLTVDESVMMSCDPNNKNWNGQNTSM